MLFKKLYKVLLILVADLSFTRLAIADSAAEASCNGQNLLQVGTSNGNEMAQKSQTQSRIRRDLLGADVMASADEGEQLGLGILGLAEDVQEHYCGIMLGLLVFMCCGGSAIGACMGKGTAGAINFVCTAGVLVYMFQSGAFKEWWDGEEVTTFCWFLSLWTVLLIVFWSCSACCLTWGVGSAILIKNEVVQRMRLAYDEREKQFKGPRREYYKSVTFAVLCDELFNKADVDKNGVLDMKELRGAVLEVCGSEEVAKTSPLFMEAFDLNGDSKVERSEFREMAKFFSVVRMELGKQDPNCISQYYEILQLRPSATLPEVRKAFHALALKWHPDKRKDVPVREACADMQELQEAYDAISEQLKDQAESPTKKKSNLSCKTQ